MRRAPAFMVAAAAAAAVTLLAMWMVRSNSTAGRPETSQVRAAPARRVPGPRSRLRDRPIPRASGPTLAGPDPGAEAAPAAVEATPAPRIEGRRVHRRPRQGEMPPRKAPVEVPPDTGRFEAPLAEGEGGTRFAAPPPVVPPVSDDEELANRLAQVPPEAQAELVVALRRLRDSGALRDLSHAQLADIMELVPDRTGVRDADRILRQHLGIGLGEFLQSRLAPEWVQVIP